MTYRVLVTEQAERNLQETTDWIARESPDGALRWIAAAEEAILSLERRAGNCPPAPERKYVDRDVRVLMFKTRHGRKYRLVFYLQDSDVIVTHIRGPGQDLIPASELESPET